MAICIINPESMNVGSDEVLLIGSGQVQRIHSAFTMM